MLPRSRFETSRWYYFISWYWVEAISPSPTHPDHEVVAEDPRSNWASGWADWGTPGQEGASWRGPGRTQQSDSPPAGSCWRSPYPAGRWTCWHHPASGSERSGGGESPNHYSWGQTLEQRLNGDLYLPGRKAYRLTVQLRSESAPIFTG